MRRREWWLGEWSVGQWIEGLLVVACIAAIEVLWIVFVIPGNG